MDCIHTAQNSDQWRAVVKAVMNSQVSWITGNSLSSGRTVSFSRENSDLKTQFKSLFPFLTAWIHFNFLNWVLFILYSSSSTYCDTDKRSNHIPDEERILIPPFYKFKMFRYSTEQRETFLTISWLVLPASIITDIICPLKLLKIKRQEHSSRILTSR
jgi:hypothetical protein